MKFRALPFFLIIFTGTLLFFLTQRESRVYPAPTDGDTEIKGNEEDENNQGKREAWFELMHQAEKGVDWKGIEHQNQLERHRKRTQIRKTAASRGGLEEIANGQLKGNWKERGSVNQAGRVYDTEYDVETDEIYLISAGGTLWKGPRTGNAWEVINQDLQFDKRQMLKFVPTGNGNRLLASIQRIPHFSDDLGVSWAPATGIEYDNSGGRLATPVVVRENHYIYLLSKKSDSKKFVVYKSEDLGESFFPIKTLNFDGNNRYELCQPHGSPDLFLVEKLSGVTRLYKVDQEENSLQVVNESPDFLFADSRANLVGIVVDDVTRFYSYNKMDDTSRVYMTEDMGASWEFRGELPKYPWGVGLYVSPSNPDLVFMGEVECHVSPNAGINWNKVNNWWAYYDDVEGKLHADMMFFNEFETKDGETFLLVSNDGGLNVSYNNLGKVENLGLLGLNVSQYYSVRTQPNDPYFVYAGSQDQGFQRALDFEQDLLDFEQVISGDYGHIVFTRGGNSLWTVYPGGWVSFYGNPQSNDLDFGWTMESEDESVWIPPLMADPSGGIKDVIYMAGGNVTGGFGSYIVRLEAIPQTGIEATQLEQDFKSASGGGEVTSLAASPLNSDRWYTATSNGRFFYSNDAGTSWDQTLDFIPSGHYLYGQKVLPSSKDPEIVYLGGSGYSNPAVWKSTDGGFTFLPMVDGLPSTLVYDLVANPEESVLFAATEAGPYVYIFADELWYDMSGMAAPTQTYWSVEYVPEFDLVRFGTYGRGIWDFEITEIVSSLNSEAEIRSAVDFEISPNPSQGLIKLELEGLATDLEFILTDLKGRVVFNRSLEGQSTVKEYDFSYLDKGIYFASVISKNGKKTKKILLQ